MPTVSSGVKSKAAFRINRKSVALDYPTNEDEATLTRLNADEKEMAGKYDQIPVVSGSILEVRTREPSNVLSGKTGISDLDEIAILGGGTRSFEGHYTGIEQILSCAMGFEKVRTSAALESPSCEASGGGANTATCGTCAAGTLVIQANGAQFTSDNIGEYARITKKDASATGINQVRRILSINGALSANITPNWATIPSLGWTVEWGRIWKHTYECAIDLNEETFSAIIGSTCRVDPVTDLMVRRGAFYMDKQVSTHVANCCMIEQLALKLTPRDGLMMDAEFVPFDVRRITGAGASPNNWDYSASPLRKQERILFAHAKFRLDDYSSSVALSDADAISISELGLTLKNNLSTTDQGTGSTLYRLEPARGGSRVWTGYLVLPRYTSDDFFTKLEDASKIFMADLVFTGKALYSTYKHFLKIYLRSLKITKVEVPTTGKELRRPRIEFQCVIPAATPAGMPAASTGAAESEVIMELQNMNPFNAFMGQNEEIAY